MREPAAAGQCRSLGGGGARWASTSLRMTACVPPTSELSSGLATRLPSATPCAVPMNTTPRCALPLTAAASFALPISSTTTTCRAPWISSRACSRQAAGGSSASRLPRSPACNPGRPRAGRWRRNARGACLRGVVLDRLGELPPLLGAIGHGDPAGVAHAGVRQPPLACTPARH